MGSAQQVDQAVSTVTRYGGVLVVTVTISTLLHRRTT